MKRSHTPCLPAVAALGAMLFAMATTHAQTVSTDADVDAATKAKQMREISNGDPNRWFREDMTMQGRLRTLQKEIGAAQHEALVACQHGPAAERATCIKEARATYQRDMAGAREQVLATR